MRTCEHAIYLIDHHYECTTWCLHCCYISITSLVNKYMLPYRAIANLTYCDNHIQFTPLARAYKNKVWQLAGIILSTTYIFQPLINHFEWMWIRTSRLTKRWHICFPTLLIDWCDLCMNRLPSESVVRPDWVREKKIDLAVSDISSNWA